LLRCIRSKPAIRGNEEIMAENNFPGPRRYNRRGGRPGLDVDFTTVCDAVSAAREGSGETMTEVAAQFGVSRGWIHKWVYPALESRDDGESTWSEQPVVRTTSGV
jgi:hypothetical protein